MEALQQKPPRSSRILAGLGVLAVFGMLTALAVSVFSLGILSGLALSGGAILVYVVPAAIRGWPLPSLDDILAVVLGVVGAIVATVLSIFD